MFATAGLSGLNRITMYTQTNEGVLHMRLYSLFAMVSLTLFLSACAAVQPASESVVESSSGSDAAHDGHSTMDEDADIPFDATFIDGMIEHHQGAI